MKDLSIFEEFDYHLCNDFSPSSYFREIQNNSLFPEEYPFTLISDLIKVEQNPKYHPEGNVWEHTMQVVDMAAQYKSLSTDQRVFMWAAILHDIGKTSTTKIRNGKLTAYEHDKVGAKLTKKFLNYFTDDELFINEVAKLVRWHMQPLLIVKKLPYAQLDKMLTQVSPAEIGVFSLCDRLGRNLKDTKKINKEIEFVKIFLNQCIEKTNDIEKKNHIINIIYNLSERVEIKV